MGRNSKNSPLSNPLWFLLKFSFYLLIYYNLYSKLLSKFIFRFDTFCFLFFSLYATSNFNSVSLIIFNSRFRLIDPNHFEFSRILPFCSSKPIYLIAQLTRLESNDLLVELNRFLRNYMQSDKHSKKFTFPQRKLYIILKCCQGDESLKFHTKNNTYFWKQAKIKILHLISSFCACFY